MFSRVRKRFTYVNVAMTLALVFAMSGGAYAAGKYIITSTKQIKPSVLKSLKGKEGSVGKEGPAGKNGVNGEKGAAGAAGMNGANGESVKVASIAPGASECAGQGGAKFTVGSEKAEACNGQTGFTETLPAKKTLEGEWSMAAHASGADNVVTDSVSFGIPLSEAPVPHYIRVNGMEPVLNGKGEIEEVTPTECKGSHREPQANPGNLCVYATEESNSLDALGSNFFPKTCAFGVTSCAGQAPAADPFGFSLIGVSAAEGLVFDTGSWAVTAQ
jgi:hypothetical protein